MFSHQSPRYVLGGVFSLTSTISKLSVQLEFSYALSVVSIEMQVPEEAQSFYSQRGCSDVASVAPQMFPLLSAMAFIKVQLFLSPCLLAPLCSHMTGAGEAVVGGGETQSELCSEI